MPAVTLIGDKWYFQTDEGAAKQEHDADRVLEMHKAGYKNSYIAKETGIPTCLVKEIIRGH